MCVCVCVGYINAKFIASLRKLILYLVVKISLVNYIVGRKYEPCLRILNHFVQTAFIVSVTMKRLFYSTERALHRSRKYPVSEAKY